MRYDVSVIIPTIEPRRALLNRAVDSVLDQSHAAADIHITKDADRRGAAANRDQALAKVTSTWCAPLDDDDALHPDHLILLLAHAEQTGADLVYPWFDVIGGTDPFPQWEFSAWDDANPHQVPVTVLARTSLLRDLGGWAHGWDPTQGEDPGTDEQGNRAGEDYRLILRAVAAGARIEHLALRTWDWYHHGKNTSGLPTRW